MTWLYELLARLKAEPPGEMSPEEHAARLRIYKRVCGMMYHPEAEKVMDQKRFDAASTVLKIIRLHTPITGEDHLDFIEAGVREIAVRYNAERGCYLFGKASK